MENRKNEILYFQIHEFRAVDFRFGIIFDRLGLSAHIPLVRWRHSATALSRAIPGRIAVRCRAPQTSWRESGQAVPFIGAPAGRWCGGLLGHGPGQQADSFNVEAARADHRVERSARR
jgi:hypothetical protein